jgi:hypothetical protein
MTNHRHSHIPMPAEALLVAALYNAREERADAAGHVFNWVGRAIRRLFTTAKVSPLETSALTR